MREAPGTSVSGGMSVRIPVVFTYLNTMTYVLSTYALKTEFPLK